MSEELTPRAKELVRAGRVASRPTRADRDRVLLALQVRMADMALPNESASTTSSLSGKAWLAWSGVGIAVLCGLGAAVFLGTPSAPPTVVSTAALAQPAAVIQPSSEQISEPESAPAPPPTPVAKSETAAPRASSRSRDRLAEEVEILSRAEADLHRGQASLALRSLEEHQRKFPNGALTAERRAARARALCALGRASEASAELTRLSRIAPGSPLERRAREACSPLTN
jgi:hypothetical protein